MLSNIPPFTGETLTEMQQAGDKRRSAGNRGFSFTERSMYCIGLLWGCKQMDGFTNIYKQAFVQTQTFNLYSIFRFRLSTLSQGWGMGGGAGRGAQHLFWLVVNHKLTA